MDKKNIKKSLAGKGVVLKLGFVKYHIKSKLPALTESLSVLYDDYHLSDYIGNSDFIDFHIDIKTDGSFGRLFTRQAQFFLDDFAPFNALPKQHAPAIIEWGMNWCVSSQINTHLIVHAAVIEKNGLAVVMPAPPGSGKSTLTASLIQEGWRLLSDELTLIRLDTFQVTPFPRPVSLKNESIDVINNRYPNVIFGPISSDTTKGNVCHIKPPLLSVKNQDVECPVGWIIFPKYQAGATTEFTKFNKARALMDVAENSFNYSRLGVHGFNVLKNVIDKADCYQFRYSQLDEAIKIFSELEQPL